MQVRALKTFSSNFGIVGAPKQLIRTGLVITVPDGYGKRIIASKLAEPHNPLSPAQPTRNTALNGPPAVKSDADQGDAGWSEANELGEETTADESSQDREDSSMADSSEGRQADGKGRPASSRRVGRRSRRKT